MEYDGITFLDMQVLVSLRYTLPTAIIASVLKLSPQTFSLQDMHCHQRRTCKGIFAHRTLGTNVTLQLGTHVSGPSIAGSKLLRTPNARNPIDRRSDFLSIDARGDV